MSSLLILVPLIGIIILNLPFRSFKRLAFPFALAMALAQAAAALFTPDRLWNRALIDFGGLGNLHLEVDRLGIVLLLSIAIVLFASVLVGSSTIADSNRRFDFTNLLVLAVIGMNGVVMVRDLFSLYVFLEIVGVSSFILIAINKDKDGLEGSFKYLMLSAIATLAMLSGIALLLMRTGDVSYAGIAAALHPYSQTREPMVAVAIFLCGLFIKGGLVPFHGWLPDAYSSAPSGVSVLLAGIVTKTTGVYTLIRVVTSVFGFTPSSKSIMLFVGAVTITIGALLALGQKDFKRMLAYSSISQMGYIVIGLGTGSPLGVAGAVFHLFNHAIFKTQLFVNAAAVEEQTGTRDMDTLGGLSARMPVTGTTSVIGFLSMAGIPPLSGFWSKLIIVVALWVSGHHMYAAIAVLASLVTCAYFLSVQRRVFFGELAEGLQHIREARRAILIPAVVLAIITVALGLLFPYVLDSFILPVKSIVG